MKVLVTGSTGFVGSHVCDLLSKEKHTVYAQARNEAKFQEFNVQGKLIKGSISISDEHQWINDLPKDLDAVVYTVGIVHAFNYKDFLEHNNHAFQKFCKDLHNRYTKLKIIFISSLAATGPSTLGHPVNEETNNLPVSSYGKSKNEAEHFLKDFLPKSWEAIIIRPPMVIGPRDPAVLDLFKMVKSKIVAFPGFDGLKNRYSFISVYDLAQVILNSLTYTPKVDSHATFFASYPTTIEYGQIIDSIKSLEKKNFIFKFPIPRPILFSAAWIIKLLNKLFKINFRLTPDKVNEITQPCWTCCSKKSVEELSMDYKWGFEQIISETFEDYKARQWL